QRLLEILEEAARSGLMGSWMEHMGGGSGAVEELAQRGKGLFGRVFGDRAGQLIDSAAESAGVRRSSMSSLMGLVTPLILGGLGREVGARRLDAQGVKGFVDDLVSAAHVTDTARAAPAEPVQAIERSGLSRFWPVLVLIPLAIIGALMLRKRDAATSMD